MLEVRSFLVHHLGQELVLQTIPGHCKIDEGSLGLNLWLVVRIGQLGVEDESETRVEETLLVPNFYTAVRERYRGRQCKTREEGRKLGGTNGRFVCLLCYLPFLMVCRPSRGSITGSTVSSRFSMRTVSPATTACSITST